MPAPPQDKRYAAYVQALCIRHANQLNLPAESIDVYIQNIKPLVDELVGCLYFLAKYLSFSEIKEICQNLELMNEESFCLSTYSKYQKHKENRSIGALSTLYYTLLLRDFYVGNFEKISQGGIFAPQILMLMQLCDEHKPYEELRCTIYFPEEEVPFLDSAGLKLLINRSQHAIMPPDFNKESFKAMVQENLTEIATTMNNLVISWGEKEQLDDRNKALSDTVPLSWIQTHMTPKKAEETQKRKKVTFSESLIVVPTSPKKMEPKKTK